MLDNMVCLDFEASAFGPRGFPVEVAIATPATDALQRWLIRPTAFWLTAGVWSEDSEAVHGLSLAQLAADRRAN